MVYIHDKPYAIQRIWMFGVPDGSVGNSPGHRDLRVGARM